MDGTWQGTLLVVLVIVIGGFFVWQSLRAKNRPLTDVTLPEVIGSFETAVPLATELKDVAQMVVFEIEQFRRDPAHNMTDDEAFVTAVAKVRSWFPDETEGLTPDKINTAIHGAVLLASQATNTIKAAKRATTGTIINDNLIVP